MHLLQRDSKKGQATVEFALIFPLAIACMAFVFVAGAITFDQLSLAEIARTCARAAIVSENPESAAHEIAQRFDRSIRVETITNDEFGFITVRLERSRKLPLFLIQRVAPDILIRASSTMMREPPLLIGN